MAGDILFDKIGMIKTMLIAGILGAIKTFSKLNVDKKVESQSKVA